MGNRTCCTPDTCDLAEWVQAELQLLADRLANKPACHGEWVELVELIDRVQMMSAEYMSIEGD